MNWRRGLLRAWIVTSLLWAIAVVPLIFVLGGACEFTIKPCLSPGKLFVTSAGYSFAGWVFLLVPPAALWLAGYALLWVFSGFRGDVPTVTEPAPGRREPSMGDRPKPDQ